MNSTIRLFLMVGFFWLAGCKKDDFPVPPASTVPLFTFTVDNNGFAPATVVFTNTSIVPERAGTVAYNWNFGDGTTSTEASPTHIYAVAGVYQVKMVAVTASSNEVKTISKTIVIKDPAATGIPVYFTDGTQLFSGLVNSVAPVMEILPVTGLQDSYGTTFDTVNFKLYISDYDAGTIYRCEPDGSGQEVFRSGLDAPNALSIDYANGHLYWDTGTGIQRGDLNSSDVTQKEDFVTGQTNDPDGICIDPVSKTIFWINYNGGVWKKNLDGTGESEIIPLAEGGSLIVANNRIYFDQYIAAGDIHLKSAKLDGSDIAVLATGITRVVYALAYEASGQKIYWGDRNKGTIMRANLDGSSAEAWYVDINTRPRGIVFGKKR
jgi:PKD repeat protein